ncbi:MAG: STAS domain-containing protein [Gammaproteobacteria bacterium]|nr:STAS domain-containing protein [Gammaproteobacteria bacterium]
MDATPKKMTVINCEPTVDISIVEELHGHLKKAFDERHVVEIEGALIERVDGSVLQLFAAFFRDAKQEGLKVSWKTTSEALCKSACLLGLTEILELPATA